MTSPKKRRNRKPHSVSLAVLAVALSACVVEPELLNSERIESKFGSYGIDLLSYHGGIRRANLYSTHDGRKVSRTYALVRFDNVPTAAIGEEHAQILAGASIGATFKASGWRVFKETLHIGTIRIPPDSTHLLELMALSGRQDLAMHVYRLLLKKDTQLVEYSTITEVHHPEYFDQNGLEKLYLVDEPLALPRDELDALRRHVLTTP